MKNATATARANDQPSGNPATIAQAIARAGIDRAEAGYLMQAVTGRDRAGLIAHGDEPLDAERVRCFLALARRRRRGEPLAYLVGRRAFHELDLEVGPGVLIPRPETELLVELALARLPAHAPVRVLDLGTGSGAIALSLACARPQADIVAVDRSAAALTIAQRNLRRLHASGGRVHLLCGDWYEALSPSAGFDLIVSNPPYVAVGDPHLAQGDLRFEPREALVAGDDGLAAIRRVVTGAHPHLKPGGMLLFEHGHDQAPSCRALLQTAGFCDLIAARDLAGLPRVAGGRLQSQAI